MKTITDLKPLIFGLGMALVILTWVNPTAAHPPQQEGSQPAFSGEVLTSADSNARIASQETLLTASYFAENGELVGVVPVPGGLTLAPEATEGSYTSGVIQSPLDYTTDIAPLWGVDLPEGASLRLETRLSTDGGNTWSDWLENPAAFYPVRDDLHSGNLIWVGTELAALQFRAILHSDSLGLSPTLRSVTLAFSDTSQGPTDGQIASQMTAISAEAIQTCPVPQPAIVTRMTWGCPEGQFSPRRPPQYTPVTHIILHQSETPNNPYPYNVSEGYAGWVRSIWNFHANILRWGDVGYNYLIDPNGKIYEGRAGGDNVIGFHDGHNAGSMGIGFIGCYGNCDDPRLNPVEPSAQMLEQAERLMAWKLSREGIDPLGSSPYAGLPNIPIIAGGRDVAQTSSPGDNLYRKLEQIRQQVAEKANCPQACRIAGVTFGQKSYNVGDTLEFTVRLVDFWNRPLPGAVVTATKAISLPSIATQATTGFDLVDRTGEYDGVDPNTQTPGLYTYTFTASDPTGRRFLPCLVTAGIQVKSDVTPTPTGATPTVTPTPTLTPTPTPTTSPTPGDGPVVRVDPATLVIPICNARGTGGIDVENAANLIAVQLQLRYNPAVVQVIDADPARVGVQITAGNIFSGGFIAQNSVDTTNGRISFAATLLGSSAITGNTKLIAIDWQPLEVGVAALTLENVILVNAAGQPITFTAQNGQAQVTSNCAGISGSVILQGRTNHGGITVTGSSGEQTQTAPDGSFTLAGADSLSFSFPGYLTVQIKPQTFVSGSDDAAGQPLNLGTFTLLAGDVNADQRVDIVDLAYVAKFLGGSDTIADLNGDGAINILDLVLAASNYGRQGPLSK